MVMMTQAAMDAAHCGDDYCDDKHRGNDHYGSQADHLPAGAAGDLRAGTVGTISDCVLFPWWRLKGHEYPFGVKPQPTAMRLRIRVVSVVYGGQYNS